MSVLTFGSLFSGIGGFDLGFERAGLRCLWQCEIDRAAGSILKRHFPGPALFTDVSKLSRPAAVDVLCGGFPCQDLSVAGRRAGLAGKRSGLWHEFRRLAGELAPRVVVIENVPGLLSSNEGRDFAVLLHGLVELGYRVAWRVLDSQYDRVAQRRRRVFIVGSLGDGSCAEILFEPESLRWDSAPRREEGQKPAPTLGCGPVSGGRKYGTDVDSCESLVVGTLQANGKAAGSATQQDAESGLLIPFDTTQITSASNYSKPGPGDPCHPLAAGMHAPAVAYTLRAAAGPGPGHNARAGDKDENLIAVGIDGGDLGFALRSSASYSGDKGDGGMNVTTVVHTLRGEGFDASEDGTGRGVPLVPVADCLTGSWHNSNGATAGNNVGIINPIIHRTGVRRLTPRECERLQGFPDDWTRWTDTGKEQADGPRYKQLGNAVTVAVAEWLGGRIAHHHHPTLALKPVA